MFLWELKKICGKFTLYFTFAMLCLTAVLTLIPQINTITPDGHKITQAQEQLLWEYKNNKTSYQTALVEYESQLAAYEEWRYQLMYGDVYPGEFVWQNHRIDTENYGDRELFADIKSVIETSENYDSTIDRLLREAYLKLNDSGIRRGEFLYEYQVNTILRYEKLQNLTLGVHLTRGWDTYFSSPVPTILLTLTIIGISVQSFLMEKRAKITPILHTSKRGELPLRIGKIAALFCVTSIQCLLFSLIPLIVYRCTTGLSNPGQLIQTVDGFLYCPYALNITECLILILLGRIFFSFTLALVVSALGQISGSEIANFGIMLVYLILQFLTGNISETSKYIDWKRYNFFETVDFGVFFERYRAINFFGTHIPSVVFMLLVATVIVMCGILISLCMRINTKESILTAKLKKLLHRHKKNQTVRTFIPSIFLFELRKLCLNRRILCLFLAAIAVRCTIAYLTFQPSATAEDKIMRVYYSDLDELGGLPGEETNRYIEDEIQYLNDCTSRYSDMMQSYYSGEISQTELQEYMEQYHYANTAWNAWLDLNEHQSYLRYMNENHKNLRYVNSEGILDLLLPDIDFVYLLCILIVIPPVFSDEYQTNFSSIQRTCRKGRSPTFSSKIACTILFAALLHILFTLIDLGFYLSRFNLINITSNILSIQEFKDLGVDLSIVQYYVLTRSVSLIASILLAILCSGISGISKKTYHSALISITIILLPIILSFIGLEFLSPLNAKNILCPISLNNTVVTLIIYGIITFITTLKSTHNWGK